MMRVIRRRRKPPRRHGVQPLIAVIPILTVVGISAAQSPPLQGLDAYIEQEMSQWQVPGLAVAVVKDDEIVFANGYGVLELGKPERVDPHTVFGIGSTAKAMTAAALGMLVDEAKIYWDDPVTKHMPDFKLHDPWVTEQVTIRDLLTHRVGIGRMIGNRIQYMTKAPRSEVLYRMRYLEPERPFRSGFLYQNVMYMAAGEVIPAVTGMSWDDFLRTRIFEPLGMRTTNTSIHQFQPGDPAASPHYVANGELTVIPRRDIDNVGPAGSVNSSVMDMAQWIRLHLGGGLYEGRRLLSSEVVRELHSAQVALPGNPGQGLSAYGLGWRLSTYHGRMISQHGGGIDGMQAALALVLEEQLGVIVLSNMLPHALSTAIVRRILDAYLGAPPRDWSRELLAERRAARERAEAMHREMEVGRAVDTGPSLPLERYTGSYYDNLYGVADVRLRDGRLELRFWNDEDAVLALHHWHHDTFRAVWPNAFHGEKWVWFGLDKHGTAVELKVEWNLRPPPSGYVRVATFERVSPPAGPVVGDTN